jgi:catechol 2,3-dioxygenase-like lactoylglutathione lyase family enzyme
MKPKLKLLIIATLATLNSFGQKSNNDLMEQRVTIITLGVSDLKKSIEFYEGNFGWKRLSSSTEDIAFFYLNGIELALFGKSELAKDATVDNDGKGFKGITLAYNTRSEIEVDEIIKRLKAKGVKIVKEPAKVFWGGYSSYISDPDGNLWEIVFNPYLQLDEKGNIKMH